MLTLIGTQFAPNMKALGDYDLDFPLKMSKTQNWRGMAGPFFEPRSPNLVRIHFFLSYKSGEIFVRLSQMVRI